MKKNLTLAVLVLMSLNFSSCGQTSSIKDSSSPFDSSSSSLSSVTESSSFPSSVSTSADKGTLSIPLTHLPVGFERTLTIEFSKPEYATQLTFNIANEAICSITSDGVVTGLKVGPTLVNASNADFDCDFYVSVDTDQFSSKVARRFSSYTNASFPKEHRTLFMGDSFFDTDEFFTNFNSFYSGYNVFSMGISATTADDWFYYSQKLVYPFDPENVVIHIGTNDINDDKCTTAEAEARLVRLFEAIHTNLPTTKIFYFGIEPSNAFKGNVAEDKRVNELTKTYCSTNSSFMTYLDSPAAFTKEDGTADTFLLRADGLHPLLTSYHIYTELLATKLTLTELPKSETDKSFEQLNDSSLNWLSYTPKSDSLTISGSTSCVSSRSFYCLYENQAYQGNIAITGHLDFTATKAFGFAEIFVSQGMKDWASDNTLQIIYQNKGSETAPLYDTYWWSTNNSIKKTFESQVSQADSGFDFKLVVYKGISYFYYKNQNFITQTVNENPCFAFGAENGTLNISSLVIKTKDDEIAPLIPQD